jgi:hypothetical protein
LKNFYSCGMETVYVHGMSTNRRNEFDLKALLFVTINDWPALSNLSGQTNKGYHACTHCLDDTESIYLDKCRNNVYIPGYHACMHCSDQPSMSKERKAFQR